ncbi:hypothetical protein BFW01_g11942 [Lasiodiplodia theobromae]|nr:hypothetical protein BFW01_g11942 [Lasiodiplodia theobromae]
MAPSDATMSQMFQRIVHVKVGKEEEIFSIHADLMVQHMFYFARVLETGPAITSWSLPTVTPRSFHLLLDYVYGGPLKLSWANVKDRPDLVDAWVLGDMVGATRFSKMIIETIATNATRPGPRCKLLPDNVCINHAYTPNVTEKNAPLRTLFVDLYVHFGTPDTLNELLAGPHNLRDFWFDYCSRSRKRDEHDTAARKRGTALRMFSPGSYSNTHPHYATPEPIRVTRPGTKAYLCHYDGVNTIVVEDGGQPLFVHRELSELRQDILLKCPPRDIVFPAGWRNAAVIFLKWLYFGRVTQETHHLRDFIRAYTLSLTLHNPQFRDDILTATISYCTRNQILPSASELALAYTCTTGPAFEPHHSPLRHLLVCWTLTHRHHLDAAGLAMPLNPLALPMDPALREALARDLGAEREARTTSMIADMAAMRKLAGEGREHPRPYADERFAGDVALGGVVRGAVPYYGDDVCRFHAAHPYFGYRAPLANGDGEVNGGVGMAAAAESSGALGGGGGAAAAAGGGGRGLAAAAAKGGVEHDRVAALLGFSTKVSKAEEGRSKQPAMKSSAATGWKNPANDMQSEVVENNPCHALLRKRNCYGSVVVGYRPKPIWPETVTNGIVDSAVTSSTESQDKGAKSQAATEPLIAKREEDYAKDPEILAMLAEVEDRLNSVSLTNTNTTNLRPPSTPPPPPSPQHHHQPRPPPALTTGPLMQHPGAGQTSFTPYTSPTAPHFTAGFPQPQYDVGYNSLSGSDDYEDNEQNRVAAFNALRLPPGWQQRRCVDGRAYWVRLVPGSQRTEATWVDPREAVVWRRSDEVSFVPGMGWGFEEGTETEADDDESQDGAGGQDADEDMPDRQQVEEKMDEDGGGFDVRDFAPAVEEMVEAE